MIDTSKAIRFMTNNYLESGYADLDVSSSHADYDFDDCLDPKQRSKVFKFGGRFLIEAGVNDKIYIAGVTYTIPAGNYSTAVALASAINTAITASGIVCTGGFNNEFTLTNGSGVSKILNLSNRTTAIWDTIGFTSVTNITAAPSFENHADENRIHWPYEEITIDFGYQAQIGFVGIISDLASELKIPQGAEIRILGNNVNSFVAPPLDQIIPWYTSGAFKFIDDTTDSVWRYVKLRITCPTGNFIPELGYLYIGDYSVFPERNIGNGFELDFDDRSILSTSDDGQVYANDKTPLRVFSSLEVGLARPDAAAFLKRIYKLKQLSTPFFVSLDPQMYFSDSFDEHLALVRFTAPPKYKNILKNLSQLNFELKEAI